MDKRYGEENKYIYGVTVEDKLYEEDRSLDNDLKRAKIDYYVTLDSINQILLDTLESLSHEERKEIVKRNIVIRNS